jgi:hypothetical protein
MRIALALFVLSLALIGASVELEPFRPTADGVRWMDRVVNEDTQAYYIAREEALTPKFRLQDFGITVLVCAIALAAATRWSPRAPKSRAGFVSLAVAAPLLTASALVFDLVQGQFRWEFPPWADSLGIPLMGVPVLLVAGLVWAFGHFSLLAGVPLRSEISLSLMAVRRAHIWLRTVCLITTVLILAEGAGGAYWYVLPGAVWLYFYASIAAVRSGRHDG